MDLSAQQIMKAAICAVILVKEKTPAELRVMQQQLANEELRKQFAADLVPQLAQLHRDTPDATFPKFVAEIVERMFANINLRLGAPVE